MGFAEKRGERATGGEGRGGGGEKIAKIGSSPRAGSGRNGKIAQQKG